MPTIASPPQPEQASVTRVCRALARWYKATAVLVLNTIVLLAALNAVLYVVFQFKGTVTDGYYDGPIRKYGTAVYEPLYPDLDAADLVRFMEETWSRPLTYEPFTEFKERPYAGRWINVHEAGFRLGKVGGAWPPDPGHTNVFVFGGSTAFGYGVADDQTIPAQLEEMLTRQVRGPVAVYNFGRAYFYSTQERILFEKLLAAGQFAGPAPGRERPEG